MILVFCAADIGTTIATRNLFPGWGIVAGANSIGILMEQEATLTNMRVQQNLTPGGDEVDYRLRVNGVDKIAVDNVDGSTSNASNLVDECDIVPGDLVEMVVIVPSVLISGLRNTTITVELI